MRWPRRVTLTPMVLPSRILNWAMERLARVTTGFWPVMRGQVADGRLDGLGVRERLAEADVDDDLGEARHLHGVGVAELLAEGRHGLIEVALAQSAAHFLRASTRVSGLAAVAAGAHAAAVGRAVVAHARGARAVRADEHDVAHGDGLRDVEDAALLDARLALRATGHGPRLGVPPSDVEAFHDDGRAGQRRAVLPAGAEARRGARSSPAGGGRRAG